MSPRLALVVSTVGRPAALQELLTSVRAAGERGEVAPGDVEVVVVDQGPASSASLHTASGLPGVVTTSGRGVSRGRNTGWPLTTAPLLAFPNDTAAYPAGTLGAVLDAFAADPDLALLSGCQRTPDGGPSMLRWAPAPAPLRRAAVHRTVISSTLVVRRDVLASLGGFDLGLGAGADGPAQSGEESDLVLRALEAGYRGRYDPDIVVTVPDPRRQPVPSHVAKMRGYGHGQGVVWRRHRLPRLLLAGLLLRKVAAAGVRGARGRGVLARADLAWAAGAARGFVQGARA